MHVRRISISRYGPLTPFDEGIAPFTVIQGPNERGKTLIIDALVRMLFKDQLKRGHYKLFGNMNRVEERPEGFVVVATHAREVKIGAESSIADVSPVEITPEDFRNVFLIRDSDLAIANPEAYYGRVSEKLCGTRSTTIARLKGALKRIGQLRSARPDSPLAVRKDREQRRIGEQVSAADRLISHMIEVGSRLEEEDFDSAARRLADVTDRRTHLEAERRRLRAAETCERLHDARDAVAASRTHLASLAALGKADDGSLEDWRALIVRHGVFEKEMADGVANGETLRAARDQAAAEWESLRAFHRHTDQTTRAWIGVLVVSIVLGAIAVAGALVTRSPIVLGAVVACVGVGVWSGVMLTHAARVRAQLAREAEVLLSQRETAVAANESAVLDKRARFRETREALVAVRAATGRDTVQELEAAVETRRSLEHGIDTRLALLHSWLPDVACASDRAALLHACEEEVARGLADLPEDAGASDPQAARHAEEELAGLSVNERSLRQQLDRARQDLRAVEVRVADLGALEAPVNCRTTRELADTRQRLLEFCEAVRRDARLAGEAIRIVEDIETEENEKVGELFGDGTPVSRWFCDITAGAYRAVYLEDGEVYVEQNDGRRLSASALSGGTFDQLYLAIRASIAERMLPESKGFFVLDDPFIKADRERMRALMKMLRHLVSRGWQVIYVTAKDEVLDALRADIAAGSVRLIELERTLFDRNPRAASDLSDAPRLL